MGRYDEFQAYRSRMNARILGEGTEVHRHEGTEGKAGERKARKGARGPASRAGGTLVTKRFFRLDGQAYEDGALHARTKELLGLVASMVLRCDDCIAYHIDRCIQMGVSDEELWESFDVALIVGGSIVIPHLRRGVEFLDEARAQMAKAPKGQRSK